MDRMQAFQGNTFSYSKSDSMLLERVEEALGVKPAIKNGKWRKDSSGAHMYVISTAKTKQHPGPNPLGPKGSIVRQLRIQTAMSQARSIMEKSFIHPDSNRVVAHALDLLLMRLHGSSPEEDAMAIVYAFNFVIGQHSFLDRERTGETIYLATRREQMRKLRAERKVEAALSRGEILTVDEVMAQFNEAPTFTFESHEIDEEIVEETFFDDEFDINEFHVDEDAEMDRLALLASRNAERGIAAFSHSGFDDNDLDF